MYHNVLWCIIVSYALLVKWWQCQWQAVLMLLARAFSTVLGISKPFRSALSLSIFDSCNGPASPVEVCSALLAKVKWNQWKPYNWLQFLQASSSAIKVRNSGMAALVEAAGPMMNNWSCDHFKYSFQINRAESNEDLEGPFWSVCNWWQELPAHCSH